MDKKTINHWIMYHEIQKRHASGDSYSKIAADLGLDRRTVKRYAHMAEKEFEAFLQGQAERRKLLAPYEEFVKKRLSDFPSASTAQVHDWLKEHHAEFPPTIGPRTVYNFVMWVRQKHEILCQENTRDHFPVEELPYGAQAQVDFGQCTLRKAGGGRQKVYFLALVLSRSRMKYLYFLDHAFTTDEAINGHEAAFAYLGGMPIELVYDQDRLLLARERLGEVLLTHAFKQYVFEQQFQLYFCRKADPQSKGKVENVIGYVKKNFLYGRVYHDLSTLQREAIAWLERTGNALIHGTTGKVPMEEWAIEKQHLKPWTPVRLLADWVMSAVRKNNTFNFRGNVYSVPQGTYRGKSSYLKLRIGESDTLLVYTGDEELLCTHRIPADKGNLIINTDHKRDKSAKITELIAQVAALFPQPDKASVFLERIRQDKPRYARDHLLVIRELATSGHMQALASVLHQCQQKQLYCAMAFKSLLNARLTQPQTLPEGKQIKLLDPAGLTKAEVIPAKSDINLYERFFEN